MRAISNSARPVRISISTTLVLLALIFKGYQYKILVGSYLDYVNSKILVGRALLFLYSLHMLFFRSTFYIVCYLDN